MTTALANRWLTCLAIALVVDVFGGFLLVVLLSQRSMNGIKQDSDKDIVIRQTPHEVIAGFWIVSWFGLMSAIFIVFAMTRLRFSYLAPACGLLLFAIISGMIALVFWGATLPWQMRLFLNQGVYAYRVGYPTSFGLLLTGPLSEIADIFVHDPNDDGRIKRHVFFVHIRLPYSTSEFPLLVRLGRRKGPIVISASRWNHPEQAEQQAATLRAALYTARQAMPKSKEQVWPPPPQLPRDGEEV